MLFGKIFMHRDNLARHPELVRWFLRKRTTPRNTPSISIAVRFAPEIRRGARGRQVHDKVKHLAVMLASAARSDVPLPNCGWIHVENAIGPAHGSTAPRGNDGNAGSLRRKPRA